MLDIDTMQLNIEEASENYTPETIQLGDFLFGDGMQTFVERGAIAFGNDLFDFITQIFYFEQL